jgi:hypothetical protein
MVQNGNMRSIYRDENKVGFFMAETTRIKTKRFYSKKRAKKKLYQNLKNNAYWFPIKSSFVYTLHRPFLTLINADCGYQIAPVPIFPIFPIFPKKTQKKTQNPTFSPPRDYFTHRPISPYS